MYLDDDFYYEYEFDHYKALCIRCRFLVQHSVLQLCSPRPLSYTLGNPCAGVWRTFPPCPPSRGEEGWSATNVSSAVFGYDKRRTTILVRRADPMQSSHHYFCEPEWTAEDVGPHVYPAGPWFSSFDPQRLSCGRDDESFIT